MTDDRKKNKCVRWIKLFYIRMNRYARDEWLDRQW